MSTTADQMQKSSRKDVFFLPEIEKDGYKIGHTGNYLLIKTKSNSNKIKITNIEYPYCIGK